jgi:cell wall-associated NlpC family hydrolase
VNDDTQPLSLQRRQPGRHRKPRSAARWIVATVMVLAAAALVGWLVASSGGHGKSTGLGDMMGSARPVANTSPVRVALTHARVPRKPRQSAESVAHPLRTATVKPAAAVVTHPAVVPTTPAPAPSTPAAQPAPTQAPSTQAPAAVQASATIAPTPTAIQTTMTAVTSTLGARILAVAETRRGDWYVYGAAGPSAFDCSGLVYWASHQLGVNMPRTTYGMLSTGVASGILVRTYKPAPGVLAFFGSGHVEFVTSLLDTTFGAQHTGTRVGFNRYYPPSYEPTAYYRIT